MKIPTQIQNVAHYRRSFLIPVPHGQTIEDLLKPEYWMHVASSLTPGDHIEAQPEDGAWWAEFLVMDVAKAAARLEVLNRREFELNDEEFEHPSFAIKWAGIGEKHQVIRLSDKVVVSKGHKRKVDAARWLQSHMAAMA